MRRMVQHLVRLLALILATGLATAVLVRYSPGALVDERELNQHLGEDSIAALRAQKARESSVGANLVQYLRGLAHGDLGYSESNDAPVGQLIADRAPTTLREMLLGLGGGWALGLGLAIAAGRSRKASAFDALSSTAAGLILSLPAALIAYLFLMAGGGAGLVLLVVLTPRIFRFARNLIVQAYGAQHVEMARARGVPEGRILWAHVLGNAAPQLLALLASSVSMAVGAAIPIEAICGSPGLGRLAWQAATARDLPLLMNLAMLVALATTLATTFSDSVGQAEERAA